MVIRCDVAKFLPKISLSCRKTSCSQRTFCSVVFCLTHDGTASASFALSRYGIPLNLCFWRQNLLKSDKTKLDEWTYKALDKNYFQNCLEQLQKQYRRCVEPEGLYLKSDKSLRIKPALVLFDLASHTKCIVICYVLLV